MLRRLSLYLFGDNGKLDHLFFASIPQQIRTIITTKTK